MNSDDKPAAPEAESAVLLDVGDKMLLEGGRAMTARPEPARIDVLERGGMVFVNRDTGGSCWIIRVPVSGKERYFRTPDDHALAVVTAELMG